MEGGTEALSDLLEADNCSAGPSDEPLVGTAENASWILANAFLIMTMQTGFGMLEAGCISAKNVANIMMKNVADVSIGGLVYWTVGYGLSFGPQGNAFVRWGGFFTAAKEEATMGDLYVHYFFQKEEAWESQFTFASTATTIVSGAIAERMKLESYMVFSAANILVYCVPCCWAWHEEGFLASLGFFDFAGTCVIHVSGGASALVGAALLGPRLGRFSDPEAFEMSSPVTALTAAFMLWFSWLGFNCGSTFGVSDGRWHVAGLVAVTTMNGAMGGALAGLALSVLLTFDRTAERLFHFRVSDTIQGILGGLVGVTAGCAVVSPRDALLMGAVGGAVAIASEHLLIKMRVDDPVGAVAVHFGAAVWGTVAVGLFGRDVFGQLGGKAGLLYGGGQGLLLAQTAGVLAITAWSSAATALIFLAMKHTMGLRLSFRDEVMGADWTEHRTSRAEGRKMEAVLAKFQEHGITNEETMIAAHKEMDLAGGRHSVMEMSGGRRSAMGERGARVVNFAGSSGAEAPGVAAFLARRLREVAPLDTNVTPFTLIGSPSQGGDGGGGGGIVIQLRAGARPAVGTFQCWGRVGGDRGPATDWGTGREATSAQVWVAALSGSPGQDLNNVSRTNGWKQR